MVLINFVKALIWALYALIFAWAFGGEFYLQHYIAVVLLVFAGLTAGDLAELGLINLFEESEDS